MREYAVALELEDGSIHSVVVTMKAGEEFDIGETIYAKLEDDGTVGLYRDKPGVVEFLTKG